MKVEDLYREVMKIVSEGTGTDERDILTSNREEHADARYLLVLALSEKLTDNEIALQIERTRQGVNYIRNGKGKMRKWSVSSNWQGIRKELASKEWWSKG